MPYSIRKLPNQDLYRVYNTETKVIHSYATTLENAKKQVKLLHMVDAGVPLKKQGGNFDEDGKTLRPFFGRVGSKVPLIKDILKIIPPHTTYVEAFVGGGSIFWNKIPAKKSVINDLDKELIDGYKILKRIPVSVDMSILDNSKKIDKTYPAVEKFINSVTNKSSDRDKLLAFTEKSVGTFGSSGKGGVYKNWSIGNKWKNIDQYKAVLKPTTIVSKDYLKVLKDYDSPTTFFYLDPPYEESGTLYKHSIIDYEKMRDVLKQLKGKFLLSINDSKYISDIFKDFNQKTLVVRNQSQTGISKEAQNRKELFISNYNMKQGGSIETDDFETRGIVSLPEFRSVKINLPTYMYKRLPDIKGKPPPYRYKLVIPITSSRNLSSRKQETSLNINQKPVARPMVNIAENADPPNLDDFSPADKAKIQEYYVKVKANERTNPDEVDRDAYEIKQRGRPLPCPNASSSSKKAVARPKPKLVYKPKSASIEGIPKPKDYESGFADSETASSVSKKSSKAKSVSSASSLSSLDDAELEKVIGKSSKGIQNIISNNNNKMANNWITYVKEYASKNGISFRDALRDPNCKAGYKKNGAVVKRGRGVVDEIGNQDLIAISYDDSELGANAGKKYISL